MMRIKKQAFKNASILTFTGEARKMLEAYGMVGVKRGLSLSEDCRKLICGQGRVVVINPNRRITVTADMFVLDDEWGRDETRSEQQTRSAIISSEGVPQSVMDFEVRMGGEIRVEFHLNATLMDNYGNAMLDGTVKLFEGTSENTDDLDGQKQFQVYVPANAVATHFVRVNNDDEGGDYVTVAITASNTAA